MRSFTSYEELEAYLRNWLSWSGEMYDFGGIVGFLEACLANIREHALEGDLEDFADRLTSENQATLIQLARLTEQRRSESGESGG